MISANCQGSGLRLDKSDARNPMDEIRSTKSEARNPKHENQSKKIRSTKTEARNPGLRCFGAPLIGVAGQIRSTKSEVRNQSTKCTPLFRVSGFGFRIPDFLSWAP